MNRAVELTEEDVPLTAIDESIRELVDVYGGAVRETRESACDFTLPLRRGVASSGAVECTISWDAAAVTLVCNRDVDAPKFQRVLLLVAGVVGSVLFLLWPFYPGQKEYGTLAWLGGATAIAVYIISLRRTSGGIAADFLQRLARRQRERLATGDR